MPLRLPVRALTRSEVDQRLASGDRRHGYFLYQTECPSCRACEPIRIDVAAYRLTKTQRRILRRGDELFRLDMGAPRADAERVELYNRHKRGRGLTDGQRELEVEGFRDFLVNTCGPTFEMRYSVGNRLAALAIVDRGADSLSAVYCCYDPEYSAHSPGTYSILKQLEVCRARGMRYLYLGLYIEQCAAMRYKARFVPHQRLIDGEWISFEPGGEQRLVELA